MNVAECARQPKIILFSTSHTHTHTRIIKNAIYQSFRPRRMIWKWFWIEKQQNNFSFTPHVCPYSAKITNCSNLGPICQKIFSFMFACVCTQLDTLKHFWITFTIFFVCRNCQTHTHKLYEWPSIQRLHSSVEIEIQDLFHDDKVIQSVSNYHI